MAQSTISAFQFPGRVPTLTATSLAGVGDEALTSITTDINNFKAYSQTTVRDKQSISLNIDYYIMCDYDINSLIGVEPSSTVNGEDDAWYFGTGVNKDGDLTISSTDNPAPSNLVYKLPQVDSANPPKMVVKRISVEAVDGYLPLRYQWFNGTTAIGDKITVEIAGVINGLANMFEVYVEFVSSTTNGVLTTTTNVRPNPIGSPGNVPWTKIVFDADETLLVAQKVGLGFMDLTFLDGTKDDADILTVTLDTDTINGDASFSTKKTEINNLYNNQNILSAWSFTFTAQGKEVNNAISLHARQQEWTSGGTWFTNDNKIVTQNGQTLGIKLNDIDNQEVVVIAEQTVYGVLNHKTPV